MRNMKKQKFILKNTDISRNTYGSQHEETLEELENLIDVLRKQRRLQTG